MWHEKELTVAEFREIWNSNEYDIEISTPDGWQPVIKWFDKGPKDIVRIETEYGYVTECAVDHLMEKVTEFNEFCERTKENNHVIGKNWRSEWILSRNIKVGDLLWTEAEVAKVRSVKLSSQQQNCYDFTVDHPNHRYWGDGISSHNSGKSLLAASVMKVAQREHDAFVLLLDTEGAGDEVWYENAGVNTTEDYFLRVPVFTVGGCTQVVSTFIKHWNEQGTDKPILIVIDSLGMLETESGQEKFMKGESPGDQGQLAKQLKKFVKNCVYLVEQKNIGFLMTNHTYDSQDMFNPDQKITGGAGIIYASSIVIATRKYKLKEKDITDDKETITSTGVHGMKSTCMVYKSRFNKPFEKTVINVPWTTGIDPYSGLIEIFENDGHLVKVGNKLQYTDKLGTEHKYFRKSIPSELLDQIMLENPYLVSREEILIAAERDRILEQQADEEDSAE